MMKKIPIILTLLSINLLWCYGLKAMDERIILDRRVDGGKKQIRVLTEQGLAKAKSLQAFYEQSERGGSKPLVESIKSSECDRDLEYAVALSREDSDIAEAIRLSTETQPLDVGLFEDFPGAEPLTFKLSNPPHPNLTSVKEDEDTLFKQALLESAQEYENQQKMAFEEKIKGRSDFEEESETRRVQQQSLLSEGDLTRFLWEEQFTSYSALGGGDNKPLPSASFTFSVEQGGSRSAPLRATASLPTIPHITDFGAWESDRVDKGKIGAVAEDQFFEDPKNPYQIKILREEGDQIWAKIKVINSSKPEIYSARRLPCQSSFIRWINYDSETLPYTREEVRVGIKCGTRSFETIYEKQEKHYY